MFTLRLLGGLLTGFFSILWLFCWPFMVFGGAAMILAFFCVMLVMKPAWFVVLIIMLLVGEVGIRMLRGTFGQKR